MSRTLYKVEPYVGKGDFKECRYYKCGSGHIEVDMTNALDLVVKTVGINDRCEVVSSFEYEHTVNGRTIARSFGVNEIDGSSRTTVNKAGSNNIEIGYGVNIHGKLDGFFSGKMGILEGIGNFHDGKKCGVWREVFVDEDGVNHEVECRYVNGMKVKREFDQRSDGTTVVSIYAVYLVDGKMQSVLDGDRLVCLGHVTAGNLHEHEMSIVSRETFVRGRSISAEIQKGLDAAVDVVAQLDPSNGGVVVNVNVNFQ